MSFKSFLATYVAVGLSPLFLVLALWAGIAANANGNDHRPSNSSYNQSSGACSIGYGCR